MRSISSTPSSLLVALLGATLCVAQGPSRTEVWGNVAAKRQVQPTSLPNNCIYTCPQFSQELSGMCAISTSQCESVQAAAGTTDTDYACELWSTTCYANAALYEEQCTSSTGDCVTCPTSSLQAYDLCQQTLTTCMADATVVANSAGGMYQNQCHVAYAVCNYELSLLSQVTPCGANCEAPCFALTALSTITSWLYKQCYAVTGASSAACYAGYQAIRADLLADVNACPTASDGVDCTQVGIYSRPCSSIIAAMQTAFDVGLAACQSGQTVGSVTYQSCADHWTYDTAYIAAFVSSWGC